MASSEEGQVIGVHSVEEWTRRFQDAKGSQKLVVVDFTASWCGPCRFIAPILADLAKKFPQALFLKVDVDELKPVAEQWEIEAMPTFIFFSGGEEVHRVVGARKDELASQVEKHASTIASATSSAPLASS